MASCDDDAVLAAACRLVERARETVGGYAGKLAPARTDQVSILLGAANCHVEVFPFQSDTVAMVLPQCAGVYPILINRSAEETDRFFALRHELGHVLAGDVDGPVFLAHEGYMSPAERVADLFALADLVPGWWIGEVRRGRTPWREVKRQIALAVAQYAEAWPPQRFGDRAELRLRMFREHGL
jgi:Zn-dependent peptidase ImmA (M78 family)